MGPPHEDIRGYPSHPLVVGDFVEREKHGVYGRHSTAKSTPHSLGIPYLNGRFHLLWARYNDVGIDPFVLIRGHKLR